MRKESHSHFGRKPGRLGERNTFHILPEPRNGWSSAEPATRTQIEERWCFVHRLDWQKHCPSELRNPWELGRDNITSDASFRWRIGICLADVNFLRFVHSK